MSRWSQFLRWLSPPPKRDPKVERVMAATRTTRLRRNREHDRLEKSLSITLERDLSSRWDDGRGHAD